MKTFFKMVVALALAILLCISSANFAEAVTGSRLSISPTPSPTITTIKPVITNPTIIPDNQPSLPITTNDPEVTDPTPTPNNSTSLPITKPTTLPELDPVITNPTININKDLPLITIPAITTYSVTGVVGAPGVNLSGVTMTFKLVSGNGFTPEPVTTDANGKWSQTGFTKGCTYRVTPDKSGLNPAFREFSSSSNLIFELIQSYNVSGFAGAPGVNLSGIKMTFSLVSGKGNIPDSVTTDAYGKWSQTGFTNGCSYRVTPSKTGLNPAYHEFSSSRSLTFALKPFYNVSGFVGAPGVNLSGVKMTFRLVSGIGYTPDPVTTDANGRWSQKGFTQGCTYRVTPSKTGLNPAFKDFKASSSLNFALKPFYNVSGFVGAPGLNLSGVKMTFNLVSGTGYTPDSVTTDANGKWSQKGFTQGCTYRVTPSKSGLNPAFKDFKASSTLNFDLKSYYNVSGFVGAPGVNLSGIKMTFSLVSGNGFIPDPVTTDANGRWSQRGFTNGCTYRVTPSKTGLNQAYQDFNSSRNITFELRPFYSVSGFAGAPGVNLSGVMMTFTLVSGNGYIPDPATTDATGKWSQTSFTNGCTYRVTPGKSGLTPTYQEFSSKNISLNFRP